MPDKDLEGDGPSLELPSFGFGRKKRRERAEASEPEVPGTPEPGPEIDPGAEPEGPATPDHGPEIFPGVAPEVPATPSPWPMPPGEEPTRRPEIDPVVPTRPTEPEQAPEIDPLIPSAPPEHPTAPEIDPLVPTRPEWQPTSDPRPEWEPAPDPRPTPDTEPPPDAEPVPDPVPVEPDVAPDDEPDVGPVTPTPPVEPDPEPHDRTTQVLPATPSAAHHPEPADVAPYDSRVGDRAETLVDDREPEREAAREPRGVRFPALPALPAVLLVGAVVGVAAVLMTWGSLRLCDTARGTASCGGGPGLLLLLAILIALTYLGGWLLRGFGVSDAGSTSFLAVGLLAVVAMLFLVDSLDEWSGAIAVPVVTVVAYALSWRVTAALVDAGTDSR